MFDRLKKIHRALGDEASRRIFRHRLAYSLSGDRGHIVDMLCTLDNVANRRRLESYAAGRETEPCVVFGAGTMARRFIADFKLPVACFCDNDPAKQGSLIEGRPVISMAQLLAGHRRRPVAVPTVHSPAIVRQLREHGWPEAGIIACEGPQYFDPLLTPRPGEVFVDAGAYDGLTSVEFSRWSDGRFDRIYLCEPDPGNRRQARENISRHLSEADPRLVWVEAGLGAEDGSAPFEASNDSRARLDADGAETIRLLPLDDVLAGSPATFIKMDIEGAELAALRGARNTIVNHGPRLAISVYHKPEDILELPAYILELRPDYALYLRHYTLDDIETVLYALPRN